VDRILRAISAALGLPYELVAKDFSKTNYSSARAALLEARRYFKVRQEWLAQKLCQPVWEMLLEEAYLRGELKANNFYDKRLDWVRARWIAPGWSWVDPLKEVKASKEAITGNISSLADEAAGQGKDWEEILEQRAREEQKRKELGLPETTVNSKTPSDEEEEKKEGAKQEEEIREILKDAEEVVKKNEQLSGELAKMGNDNNVLKNELAGIKTRLEKVLVDG
jgi:capsid protein